MTLLKITAKPPVYLGATKDGAAITAETVGLGNVDNTSDADKPISTATQAALDLKVDKVADKGLSTEDYTTIEKTKLGTIENGATADQTDAEIKTAYENNADTNAYTDAEKTNLANQSGTNTGDQDLSVKVDKVAGKGLSTEDYTTAEKSKLAAIEAGAEVNNISDANATDLTGGGETTLHSHATAAIVTDTTSITTILTIDGTNENRLYSTIASGATDLTLAFSDYPTASCEKLVILNNQRGTDATLVLPTASILNGGITYTFHNKDVDLTVIDGATGEIHFVFQYIDATNIQVRIMSVNVDNISI